MPRTVTGSGGRGCTDMEAPGIIRGSPGSPGTRATPKNPYAERQSPRKRAFRVCPASLQAHLREGRRAGRDPQARVLREADPGAQAQGRRRGEAPGPPQFARRHQAPAPVLRFRDLRVATPRHPEGRHAQRRRPFAFPLFRVPIPESRVPSPAPMTLKQQLTSDMKSAMKSGDKTRLGVIRLINASIKQKEVDERIELDDAQVLAVLEKMVKQRRDSISQYDAAGRDDLSAIEHAEMAVIEHYLPAKLGEAAILDAIDAAIARTGASGPADMGKLMGVLKPALAGQADMGEVSKLVKQRLSGS